MGVEVAVGAVIGGALLGAAGSISAGNAAASEARTNAALAEMEAAENERRSRRESSALIGRSRAVAAAQGTTLEGSPMLIIEDTAAEAEIEALHVRKGGSLRAAAFGQQAKAAQTTGLFNAGASLLGGAATAIGFTL